MSDETAFFHPAASIQHLASRRLCVCEAHCSPRAPFQRPMNSPGVGDEVQARPRITREKLRRQQITLQAIAATACQNEVARDVGPSMRERVDVVERGVVELEHFGAIHAATTAVPHCRALDRSLLMPRWNVLAPPSRTWSTWEGNTVIVPTTGQFHLSKKRRRPAAGSIPVAGRRKNQRSYQPNRRQTIHAAVALAACRSLIALVAVERVRSSASGRMRGRRAAQRTVRDVQMQLCPKKRKSPRQQFHHASTTSCCRQRRRGVRIAARRGRPRTRASVRRGAIVVPRIPAAPSVPVIPSKPSHCSTH